MNNEAHTIFGDSAGKIAKMASVSEQGFQAIIDALSSRVDHHSDQYAKLSDKLVMEGSSTKATLVRAAHVRGELANTKFIIEELLRVRGDDNNK